MTQEQTKRARAFLKRTGYAAYMLGYSTIYGYYKEHHELFETLAAYDAFMAELGKSGEVAVVHTIFNF